MSEYRACANRQADDGIRTADLRLPQPTAFDQPSFISAVAISDLFAIHVLAVMSDTLAQTLDSVDLV